LPFPFDEKDNQKIDCDALRLRVILAFLPSLREGNLQGGSVRLRSIAEDYMSLMIIPALQIFISTRREECGDNSLIALKHPAANFAPGGTRQSTSTPAVAGSELSPH
jgi:hypothetical protein